MSSATIDACILIDLLATGHVEAILQASGLDWHLSTAVESEVQHIRQYDLAQPGKFHKIAVDLSSLKTSGVLQDCEPADQTEQDRFIHYAAQFRSDGEAMCIAIAEQRGWVVATDDRKAILVARNAGLTVMSCPELVKRWADMTGQDQESLFKVLQDIQVLAQFKPIPMMSEYQWWVDVMANPFP